MSWQLFVMVWVSSCVWKLSSFACREPKDLELLVWIFVQMSTCFTCSLSSHCDSGAFSVAIRVDVNAFFG